MKHAVGCIRPTDLAWFLPLERWDCMQTSARRGRRHPIGSVRWKTKTDPQVCDLSECGVPPTRHQWQRVFVAGSQLVVARQALPAGGSCCGGEERSLCGRRAQRASKTDSPRLFERSERNERSEFAARPQSEHHSGVGAKRRPPQHEPPAGSACRAAPALASESGSKQTAATSQERNSRSNRTSCVAVRASMDR